MHVKINFLSLKVLSIVLIYLKIYKLIECNFKWEKPGHIIYQHSGTAQCIVGVVCTILCYVLTGWVDQS